MLHRRSSEESGNDQSNTDFVVNLDGYWAAASNILLSRKISSVFFSKLWRRVESSFSVWRSEAKRNSWHGAKVSSMVLIKMKETADDYLGKEVTHTVVKTPAYFQ